MADVFNFKPGDQLVYAKTPGYDWVEDLIDTDLLQTVVEVVEVDGHKMLKLEDVRTHEKPVPAYCFEYDTDCEDAWCGGPVDGVDLEVGARAQEGITVPVDYPTPEVYAKHQKWLEANPDVAAKPVKYANPEEWEKANPDKGSWSDHFWIWF